VFLSRLRLNPRLKEVRRDLANPYEMHRTLSRAVSEALTRNEERMLWRLEPTRPTELPIVLVQTLTEPDWSALPLGYAEEAEYKPFCPVLKEGQVLRFRLLANPVKRARDTGKRVALKTPEEKLRWLGHKLAQGGMELVETSEGPLALIQRDTFLEVFRSAKAREVFRSAKAREVSDVLPEGNTTKKIRLQATLFEGVLRIKDPEQAVETLKRGIGPAKGLGLGLLSLRRL